MAPLRGLRRAPRRIGLVTRCFDIAVISGDGIGPEVVDAAVPAIQAAARAEDAELHWSHLPYGADHYLRTGETLPKRVADRLLNEVHALFVGALGDPRIPGNEHARDILLGLRYRLDLYVNFRPCRLLHRDLCPLKEIARPAPLAGMGGGGEDGRNIDFVIFRENTEGIYSGRGTAKHVGTPDEERVAEEVHTAPKVERIIRAAFQWAAANGRPLVTMTDKSNVISAHALWQRLFEEIGAEYAAIRREHRYVDALAMELVRNPERFGVIVTNNLLGDILSDLGAQLVGGLGLAASANLHPGRLGLFEPVHGSAPPLAGKGTANPMAAMRTGALMLGELGLLDASRLLEEGVSSAIAAGVRTPDIGGLARTTDVARWVEEWIRKR